MCKHEQFIKSLGEPQSNREYWLMTEIFVYLHNGKDYCDCQKTAHNSDYAKCADELFNLSVSRFPSKQTLENVLKKHFA